MATEEELKASEDVLRAELKRHDWYYTYSDDGGVFRRGNEHRKKIDTMFKSYKDQVGAAKAHALWNEYAPADYQLTQNGEAS